MTAREGKNKMVGRNSPSRAQQRFLCHPDSNPFSKPINSSPPYKASTWNITSIDIQDQQQNSPSVRTDFTTVLPGKADALLTLCWCCCCCFKEFSETSLESVGKKKKSQQKSQKKSAGNVKTGFCLAEFSQPNEPLTTICSQK